MRRVALFIPCYMDAFGPEVGVATLEPLERLDCTVDYPFDQTAAGSQWSTRAVRKRQRPPKRYS